MSVRIVSQEDRVVKTVIALCARVAASAASCALPAYAQAAEGGSAAHYQLAREVPLPGDEGWDYLSFDAAGGRLFVTHGTRVQVVDGASLAVVGEIPDTPGVHGVAIAQDLGRGYVSAGRADSVVVFDLHTLKSVATIKVTGANPDAILYDPFSRRVFTFNGRGRNVTAIDTATNEVVGTLPVDAKPEFAATDGAGHVYVNLEDRNALAMIDPKALKISATWPLSGCEEPSGLAIDRAHARLFSVCSNKIMVIVDAATGQVVAREPIGARVDGVAFDATRGLAFATAGEGNLTIVHEDSPQEFSVVQTLATRAGARTVAVDEKMHRVFSVTARFGPPAQPTKDQPYPRPRIEPGSFELLVMSP